MNSEFFEAVKALAAEKNISTDYLFTKIEAALAAAMRKNYGGNNKEREVVKCKIDTEAHTIKIWAELEVVDEITEPGAQILPDDAKKLDNILVVVVRYFGGTLLGTGGLMVAYREASKDALEKYGQV